MYRLTGTRRSYDWGSSTSMFEFLNTSPDGEPFAELWLGAHPTGPSIVSTPAGTEPLDLAISKDEPRYLGDRIRTDFGRLPYLVKLLAPARPLSMQVHPSNDMARAGFRDEERRSVPRTHPQRSFKDEHHKPEMVYAITRFEGLVGFRSLDEVSLLMNAIGGPLTAVNDQLTCLPQSQSSLHLALEQLLNLTEPEIYRIVEICRQLAETTSDQLIATACETVDELSGIYPEDIGAVISLMLNRVVLKPGQSVFLAAGVPHAYLGGFALEVMANSDNVLRLGLTSKHVDVPSMLQALDFSSSGYVVETASRHVTTYVFRPPVEEFALSVTHAHRAGGNKAVLPGHGPRILVCLEGTIGVTTQAAPFEHSLAQGDALFIPADEGPAIATGAGVVAEAFVP